MWVFHNYSRKASKYILNLPNLCPRSFELSKHYPPWVQTKLPHDCIWIPPIEDIQYRLNQHTEDQNNWHQLGPKPDLYLKQSLCYPLQKLQNKVDLHLVTFWCWNFSLFYTFVACLHTGSFTQSINLFPQHTSLLPKAIPLCIHCNHLNYLYSNQLFAVRKKQLVLNLSKCWSKLVEWILWKMHKQTNNTFLGFVLKSYIIASQ